MIARTLVLLLVAVQADPALAETLLVARTIRAQAIITPDDITVADVSLPGTLKAGDNVVGMEARVVLYAGRPIRPEDIGPPAIVERNAPVLLIYQRNGLTITAEGRALGRAGVGDSVRVMNLTSRTTVSGSVQPDGSVLVGTAAAPSVP
jgi:flagella basal body P-ring formation protein FlgA